MRASKLSLVVCLAAVALSQSAAAQPLVFSLFERSLESLRQQTGIPGLSAAIVQSGRVVWETGLGHRDVEASLPAAPDTLYPIGDVTETFATVLLLQCYEGGRLDFDEPVNRFTSTIPEINATARTILAHASDASARGYRFDRDRFAALTPVAEQCGEKNYRRLIVDDVLNPLSMADTVPGRDLAETTTAERFAFGNEEATRYATLLRRMAVPYRVDRNGRASRSDYSVMGLNAATGLVSTVRDLARYDAALGDGALVRRVNIEAAWTNASTANGSLPTGLGWFVQTYNGERLVWHFNLVHDAYSALILKVPGRDLTLILLANSDGLSAPFSLADGDVTSSLFARTFLRLFL